jgi:hypothetical protein
MDRQNLISRRNFNVSILAIATAALMPTGGKAHVDDKVPSMSAVRDNMVKATMLVLRAKTEKLGEPKIEGKDPLAGKDAPALYFGTTKMNNSSDVVDKVVERKRRSGHALREDWRRVRACRDERKERLRFERVGNGPRRQ